LKLDWFSSETEKPENMSSHSKSYAYQDNRPTGSIIKIPADIRFRWLTNLHKCIRFFSKHFFVSPMRQVPKKVFLELLKLKLR